MSQGEQQKAPVAGKDDGAQQAANAMPRAGASAAPPLAAPAGTTAPASHTHNTRHRKAGLAASTAAIATTCAESAVCPHVAAQPQRKQDQQHAAVAFSSALQAQPASPRASARLQQKFQQQQPQRPAALNVGSTQLVPIQNGSAAAPSSPRRSTHKGKHERQAGAPLLQAPSIQQQQHAESNQQPSAAPANEGASTGPGPSVEQQQQQQQHGAAVALAAAPPREHTHNTRRAQRQREERDRRKVTFAPGPWADKFSTADGHPDHEGQLARQRRSSGMGWGRDLTPSAVRAVEAELGEDCRPSIDRLKRRVGLLPLRKKPLEYYLTINGGTLPSSGPAKAAAAAAAAAAANGRAANGHAANGSARAGSSGEPLSTKGRGGAAAMPPTRQQQQQQQQQQPVPAGTAATNSMPISLAPARLKQQHDSASSPQPKPAAEASVPPIAVTFSRKRAQPDTAAHSPRLQQNGTDSSGLGSPAKRASQRLGGLSGPVGSGLLGTFSKR